MESDTAQLQDSFSNHLSKIRSLGYLPEQPHDAEGQKFPVTIPEK